MEQENKEELVQALMIELAQLEESLSPEEIYIKIEEILSK